MRAAPKSFLHVDDFDSPKRLADYLVDLSNNDTAYLEYLSWRFNYKLRYSGHNTFCDLCKKLYQVQCTDAERSSTMEFKSALISFPPHLEMILQFESSPAHEHKSTY
jgi:hypothetical protein